MQITSSDLLSAFGLRTSNFSTSALPARDSHMRVQDRDQTRYALDRWSARVLRVYTVTVYSKYGMIFSALFKIAQPMKTYRSWWNLEPWLSTTFK
ncbi:unnamed protein product [Diplocarpon coronariae]